DSLWFCAGKSCDLMSTDTAETSSRDASASTWRNRYAIPGVGVVAAILIIAAAVGVARVLRENVREDRTHQMSNLSLMLAEHAGQTLFSAQTVLDVLYDAVQTQDLQTREDYDSFASAESSFRLLRDRTSANPIIDVATFVRHNGQVLNFTRSFPPPSINLSERDYFMAHAANPGMSVHTSAPVHNKGTGDWVFYLSRRVDNSRGEMLGLVLVGVSVEVFSQIYKKVASDIGLGASISLYRDDFMLMTRWPLVEESVGERNLTSATHRAIAIEGKTNDVVLLDSARLTEGNALQARIAAPRKVDRYPFIVTPVITDEAYLRGWREALWWIAGLALISLALLFWCVRWLLHANQRVESELFERRRAQTRVEHLAYHDTLTALPNRRLLSDRLQRCVAACERNPANSALLFLDLDNFKEINDTYGHDHGDLVLQEVSKRLESCVRREDTVARVGGDEFAILLGSLDISWELAAAKADAVAKKITSALARPIPIAGFIHHSTVSVGMTLFGMTPSSVDDLFKRADIAMYQAKTAGKNTHQFFDSQMQQQVEERTSLVNAMRDALANHEFVLHFQPQVRSDGTLEGAEALLRWTCKERGPVSPVLFIPVAEQTRMIEPLGQWVLDMACKTLAQWSGRPDLAHLTLAVNVSSQQFRQPNFVESVLDALERNGAPANQLKLELTESTLAHDLTDVRAKMSRLRQRGLRFALDDFGTGYSSMNYLRELPIDQLKIDLTFVRNITEDPNDATIVRAITNLGLSLGMDVIAEGVETQAQHNYLMSIDCPAFQGFLFGPPMPATEFERFAETFIRGTR
ncbi:MAG: EAL domain-containing protein, partial [Burkholderiales bacterium]